MFINSRKLSLLDKDLKGIEEKKEEYDVDESD
jgi:hypothetical protein